MMVARFRLLELCLPWGRRRNSTFAPEDEENSIVVRARVEVAVV